MKTDERTPLTREAVKAMLMRKKKIELVMFGILGGVTILILLLATAADPSGAIIGISLIALVLLCGIPTLRHIYLVRKGSFSILEADLMSMYEERRGQTIVYVYDFGYYGKIRDQHRTTWDLAEIGTTMYIVILHGKKDKIAGLYHPLLYRLTK